MKEVIPNYFIVGAHKCATTFMAEHLRLHPEVFMTEPKEPHHFARDICPEISRFIGLHEYQSLFRGVRDEKAIGEASTWYLYSEVAAAAIHRVNPEARIIIMLRNPTDFLHALHSELIFDRHESITDFECAINSDYHSRRAAGIPMTSLFECGFEYRKSAMFCHQIERYLSRFGRDRVHFVLLDDVKASPAAAYEAVLQFLEVDPSFKPEFTITNANKRIRAPMLVDAMYSKSWLKMRLARSLPLPLRRRILDFLLGVATEEAPREPMPTEMRRRLMRDYENEVRALAKLIDRDLSSWLPRPEGSGE